MRPPLRATRGQGEATTSYYTRARDRLPTRMSLLLPFFLPTILAAGATASGDAVGLPRIAPLEAGLYNAYSWGLVLMLAVVAGYGRGQTGGTRANAYDAGAK